MSERSVLKKIILHVFFVIYGFLTLSSAHAANKKLNEIKSKYDTTNPNANRASQDVIRRIRERNYSRVSGDNVESKIISKYYSSGASQSGSVNFGNNLTSQDFQSSYNRAINQAKYISQGTKNPTYNENSQSFESNYAQNGSSKLKRNSAGKIIIQEKTSAEKGEQVTGAIDQEEMFGNDINHADTADGAGAKFTMDSAAGSDIDVKTGVQHSLGYLQSKSEGTGMMQVDAFKAVMKGEEENKKVIEQDDPLFNASYTAIQQTEATAFNDCTTTSQVIDVSETYPRDEFFMCSIAKYRGPRSCEVHREVAKYEGINFFDLGFDGVLDASKVFSDGNYGMKGNKHSSTFHRGHWDVKEDNALSMYAKGGAAVSISAVNNTTTKEYVQNVSLWLAIEKVGTKYSPSGRAFINQFSVTFTMNMTTESLLNSVVLNLGETGALSYPNYNTSDDMAEVYLYNGSQYIQVQLDNTNRTANITEEFRTMFIDTVATSMRVVVFSNIAEEEFRFKHKKNAAPYRRQLGPYGLDRERAWYHNDLYPNYKPAVTMQIIQPSMQIDTKTVYYPEGCLDLTLPPDNQCTFDGTWTILEEGSRGYPKVVLDQLTELFPDDTGNKSWIATANNYECDPWGGQDQVIDGVTYTWEEAVDRNPACGEYEANSDCTAIESTCDFYDPQNDECVLETRRYQCSNDYSVDKSVTITNNTCNMELPCMGGDCEIGDKEVNDSFDDALIGMSIAGTMREDRNCANDADPNSCEIFAGNARQCRYEKTFGIGNDCCEVPEGVNVVEFVAASWNISKATGLNDIVYDASAGAWESAVTMLGNTSAGQSISQGYTTMTESLSSIVEGVAGNATNTVATTTGTETLTEVGFGQLIEEVKKKTMETVYNALPQDLANLVFDSGAASTGDYIMSEGMNQAFTMLSYLATAYSYYMYFKLAINLITQCEDDPESSNYESDMGINIGNRKCIFIGRENVNFIQNRQLHCCFNSPLARIIVEQSLPQLGYSNKKAFFEAGCPGLTPLQLSALDWDRIDLSEWYGLMEESGLLPSTTDEEQLTGGGRLVNGEERNDVSSRTQERFNGTGLSDRQKQLNKDMKAGNVDCSITPRPAICGYTGGNRLGSGN
ncbi:MAG: conjugal transfer protein TraN [Methylococcales bacterium]